MESVAWPTGSCQSPRDILWAALRLRDLKPHLVHARFAAINATMLAAAATRVPVRVVGYSTSPAAVEQDWRGSFWALRGQGLRTRVILKLATHHSALSPGHSDEVRAAYGLGSRRVDVNPIGVRDQRGSPPTEPRPARHRAVVCLARLTPAKGQRRLIEALSGSSLDLTLVGDGPDRVFLEELALHHGVRTRFAGLLPPAQARAELGGALVSVLLTAADAFALAVAESLSVGTPVVTTMASGPGYMVRDGVEGFIVDPDDPLAVRSAIDKAMGNRWAELSGAARRRFLDGFELERQADLYADYLETLAATGRAKWCSASEDKNG